MGYTHYWTPSKESTRREDFEALAPVFEKIVEMHKDIITGVELTHAVIAFDGVPNHETFCVWGEGGGSWSFCKTAYKPYDIAVCECLLALAAGVRGFSFRSDGFRGDVTGDTLKAFLSENWDEEEGWTVACKAFVDDGYYEEIRGESLKQYIGGYNNG